MVDEDKSLGAVPRDLDLTEPALRSWVERARADRSGGKTGLTSAEREELASLRNENRILREEREVLKSGFAPLWLFELPMIAWRCPCRTDGVDVWPLIIPTRYRKPFVFSA